ncbi:MAG: hypothetical protein NTV88_01400 [Candidatus Micrarchaeota archaeon]|nr:hypothetical protein [Candidatus Micrarchaeota archaeon]
MASLDNIEQQIPEGITVSAEDAELLKFIEGSKPKIYVVGAGGSGCNTMNRIHEVKIEGVKLIAMNTDVQHLVKMRADKKILLGKKATRGMGAGSNPALGEAAAKESQEEIRAALSDGMMVFITCGMGGGTGTGSAHIIAEQAKAAGALTIAVVTLPFTSEGKIRMQNLSQRRGSLTLTLRTLGQYSQAQVALLLESAKHQLRQSPTSALLSQ